jgi:hypothetical protein
MADVLEWGEAISQSMGYEKGEILRAYINLISIQYRHKPIFIDHRAYVEIKDLLELYYLWYYR